MGNYRLNGLIEYTWTFCDGTRYHLRKSYSFWILSVAICRLYLKKRTMKEKVPIAVILVVLQRSVNPWI